jgi:WD40 repeat protein
LKKTVETLGQRCQVLSVENEALKAEVEMYRNEFAMTSSSPPSSSSKEGGQSSAPVVQDDDSKDHFVQGGNGIYAQCKEVTLEKLHGISNPACSSLSHDDTLLATGGADQNITLCQWGAALGGDSNNSAVVEMAVRVACGAPVISVGFARKPRSPFVAAGCMDGTVHVVHFETSAGGSSTLQAKEIAVGTIKHAKYVRTVVWNENENLLASSSADGCVQLHKIIWNGLDDNNSIQLEKVKTFILPGPIESLCFHNDHLVCFARGTPYLSYFDLKDNFEHTKKNLNQGLPGNAAFDDHVSFAVMDMCGHGNYLALATDTSRNIIVDFETGKQIRNLYGHKNDGYSQPKVAWSQNGQYLYGNTQDASNICVWDIASETIVQRLEDHSNPIRDMYSSQGTETLVTTSFDKKTHIWLAPST